MNSTEQQLVVDCMANRSLEFPRGNHRAYSSVLPGFSSVLPQPLVSFPFGPASPFGTVIGDLLFSVVDATTWSASLHWLMGIDRSDETSIGIDSIAQINIGTERIP
jgi:hypothetical protein